MEFVPLKLVSYDPSRFATIEVHHSLDVCLAVSAAIISVQAVTHTGPFKNQDAPAPAPSSQAGEGDPHAPGDVPNGQTVVRGGINPPPSSGTWSGAQGATVEEAGKGVPNGQVQVPTGGQIRAAGGDVRPAPEAAHEGGPINGQHVNVTDGGSAFGPPRPNPAPTSERVPGGNTLPKPQKPTSN